MLYTNQCRLTCGFIVQGLIPLAEDFGTWTQEISGSFARIFCMRCIQDPSVECYFSGLRIPCFCDLYEWSRLAPLDACHESAVLAAQHPRLKNFVAWWLLDSGSHSVKDSQNCRGHVESALLIRFVERLPFRCSSLFVFASVPTLTSGLSYQQPLLATALPSLYVPAAPPVEQLNPHVDLHAQPLIDRVTEKSSDIYMDPRGCSAALDTTRDFFSAALARVRECDLPPAEIVSLVHRPWSSTEHQAAQQLVSAWFYSLSGLVLFPERHFRWQIEEEGAACRQPRKSLHLALTV